MWTYTYIVTALSSPSSLKLKPPARPSGLGGCYYSLILSRQNCLHHQKVNILKIKTLFKKIGRSIARCEGSP